MPAIPRSTILKNLNALIAEVETKPHEASVALREMMRAPDEFSAIYKAASDAGIRVQHILYDQDDLRNLLRYLDDGTIPGDMRKAIFVLGRYAQDGQSSPRDLAPFLDTLDGHDLEWSVCAFGKDEHECLLAALDHGGNVRVGFENNRFQPDGRPYMDNAASVRAFVQRAANAGFEPRKAAS